MTKKEFMRELERRLSQIPEGEKTDALNYYEDYFAEASITDDMLVPETMGTPEDIAKQIIEEVVQKEATEEYFNENADVKKERSEYIPYYRRGEQNTSTNKGERYTYNGDNSSRTTDGNVTNKDANVVAIILLIISCPFWIGIVIAAAACLFAAMVTLIALVFGFGVAGVALICTAFLSSAFAGGILLAGTGMILLALAILMVIPLVLFCIKFLPWLVNGIVKACKRLFGTGKEQA